MTATHRVVLALAVSVLYGAVALAPSAAVEPSPPAKSETTAYKAGELAGDMWQSTKEAVRKAWEATRDTAQRMWHSGKDTAQEGMASGKQTAQGAWDATKERSGEVTRDLKEGWRDGTR